MHTQNPTSCIFCQFDPRFEIARNDIVFATYFPRAIKKGHFVVATVRHVPHLTAASSEEVAEIMKLGRRIAQIVEQAVGAEKTYVAAIGDMDKHFHMHFFPRISSEAPMGRHIMLDSGWKGEVGQVVGEAEVLAFIAKVKEELAASHH